MMANSDMMAILNKKITFKQRLVRGVKYVIRSVRQF